MGKGKESPPDPECFDGASPTRETAENRVLLRVGDDVHLTYEYDPRQRDCHRAFKLFTAGNAD